MDPINRAAEIIQQAVTNENPNIPELNNAIRTLAQDFQNVSGDVMNRMRQVDFAKIQAHVTDSKASTDEKTNYIALSTLLIKIMEKAQPATFVHQAYHGNAIAKGIALLQEHLSEQAAPELSSFVRQYTANILADYSTKTKKSVYLIRDSSSVLGTQNFVISMKKEGNPVQHYRITRNQEKWVINIKGPDDIAREREFNSIDEILSRIGLRDALPVPIPTERQMGTYAIGYVTAPERANISMAGDPILQMLNCPITQSRFTDPLISPSGNTFSREGIVPWVDQRHNEPISREELFPHMLRQNLLVAQLARMRVDQWEQMKHTTITSLADWKRDPLLSLFEDPITHKMIKDPVVATDGQTYDREELTRYLGEHQNKLPNGMGCTAQELIPNLTAKGILEERMKKFA